jgi:prophage regulatory protein
MHKILRITDVKERTGLGRSTIYKMVAAETFPKPIGLSVKAVGWLESDIQNWIEHCIKSSSSLNKYR